MSYLITQILIFLVAAAALGAAAGWILAELRARGQRGEELLQLEKRLAAALDEREILEKERDALSAQIAELREKVQGLSRKLEEREGAWTGERENLEKQRAELDAAHAAERKDLLDRIAAMEAAAKQTREETDLEHEKLRARIAELNGTLIEERARTDGEAKRLRAAAAALEEELAGIRSRSESGSQEASGRIADLEVELRTVQMKLIHAENTAKDRIAALEKDLGAQRALAAEEINARWVTIRELEGKLLQMQKSSTESHVRDMQGQVDRARATLKEKEDEFAARLRGIEGLLKSEREKAAERERELSGKLRSAEERAESAEREAARLKRGGA